MEGVTAAPERNNVLFLLAIWMNFIMCQQNPQPVAQAFLSDKISRMLLNQ